MSNFRKFIDKIFTKISLGAIYIYQKTLSPDKGIMSPRTRGTVCRHEPHCSEYAVQSLHNRGFLDSAGDIATRVINCKPGYTKIYDPAKYKVVFASSSQIGLPFLEEILDNPRFELVGIISQPDKPGGRGMHDISNPIKKFRKEKLEIEDMPIIEPLKLNPEKSQEGKDFARDLSLLDADFIVVISYGRIIPQAILDIPKLGPINIHGSILPQYRGASPIQTSLLNGDAETGITIMYMDAKLDEGDIIDIYKFPITINDNSETIINRMGIVGPKFMADTIVDFAHGHLYRQPQIHEQATFSSKFTKEDAKIDIHNETTNSIYHKYQGYYLRPKVRFEIGDKRFVIEKIDLNKNLYISGEFSDLPLIDNDGNLNKSIKDIYIKPEGKKSMDFKARKNGYLK